MDYIVLWPFMSHVGLVLFTAWLAASLQWNISFIFLLGFLYLYQIEKRQREKLHRRIRHEERKSSDKNRLSEGETVQWLNLALGSMWPICLENFTSQIFLLPISPWFLNTYKPWPVRKVFLQHLDLGKNPPMCTMIQILDKPMDGDHLVMKVAIEFLAGEDMSAVLTVQMRRRLGFGLWFSSYISKLRLEGTVTVGVRFMEGWPIIGRIRLCFAKPPLIHMTARPLSHHGVDMAVVPGIAGWLDKLLVDALEQSLVEPNMLLIDVEKLVNNVLNPHPPKGPTDGNVHKKQPVATVLVEILKGTQLQASDRNGLSDPFVKGSLGTTKIITTVQWKTLNPNWNEKFRLPIISWGLPNLLFLHVRDKDPFHDNALGYCVVLINSYQDGKRNKISLPLRNVNTGMLHLAITVQQNAGVSQNSEVTHTNATAL